MSNIIEKLQTEKIVVNCRTYDESMRFLLILDLHGIRCVTNNELPSLNGSFWYNYKKQTCYHINDCRLYYSDVDYCLAKGYKIITFDEFMEEYDLLWQREEVKEMTVDEISELLGYKVKIVGGKD